MKTTAKSIAILLMMGLAAFFFNSCNKEKPEAPEHIEINTYDDLDYFQNSIVHIDSLHNFIYRAYGVPLYADDTSQLYIGVESLEEARDIFMNWIAPDAVVKENSGDLTCELTDENGLSQGTVFFRHVELNGRVAEVSVSNGTRLYYFSQVTFLYNDAWPLVNSAQSRWHKFDIVHNIKPTNIQGYFHDVDRSLNWVCVRESGNGMNGTNSTICRNRAIAPPLVPPKASAIFYRPTGTSSMPYSKRLTAALSASAPTGTTAHTGLGSRFTANSSSITAITPMAKSTPPRPSC